MDTVNTIETKAATTSTDLNGNVFFQKGSMSQLMTPLFKMFVLFSQPLFMVIGSLLPDFGWIITLALYTWWFIYDRDFLAKEEAFVPHGAWWLFLPVYLYKRQHRNGNSRLWFLWYFLSYFAGILIAAIILASMSNR